MTKSGNLCDFNNRYVLLILLNVAISFGYCGVQRKLPLIRFETIEYFAKNSFSFSSHSRFLLIHQKKKTQKQNRGQRN